MRVHRLAVLIIAAVVLSAGNAAAAPSATDSCAGLSGGARGLCNAYCNAQRCNEHPGDNSCEQLRRNFEKHTGRSVLPCDGVAATPTVTAVVTGTPTPVETATFVETPAETSTPI